MSTKDRLLPDITFTSKYKLSVIEVSFIPGKIGIEKYEIPSFINDRKIRKTLVLVHGFIKDKPINGFYNMAADKIIFQQVFLELSAEIPESINVEGVVKV